MMVKMRKKFLLLFLASFQLLAAYGQGVFEKISNKTWFEESGLTGVTVVFVKTKEGLIKAFRQINGSGVPVIATETYDVEIKQDTIFLFNTRKTQTNLDTEIISYTYSDRSGLSQNDSTLRVLLAEPIIYVLPENGRIIDKPLNANKLTKFEFEKNQVYINDKVYWLNGKER